MLYQYHNIHVNRSAQQLARRRILHHILEAVSLVAAISPWVLLLWL
jgi:hypothetical protein